MKARNFFFFDLLQNSQGNTINSRQKKNSKKKSQHSAKENEFTPEQRKTRPQNKPGKFIGSRLRKLFQGDSTELHCASLLRISFRVI